MTAQPDRECPECGAEITEDEWDDMLDMCDDCATQAAWDEYDNGDDLELDDDLE